MMRKQEERWKEEREQELKWSKWKLTPKEIAQYKAKFAQEDADNDGFITGGEARKLFASYGLPMEVLGKIWTLSDRNKDGKLDWKEYAIALYLITRKSDGEVIPTNLPDNLLKSVYPELDIRSLTNYDDDEEDDDDDDDHRPPPPAMKPILPVHNLHGAVSADSVSLMKKNYAQMPQSQANLFVENTKHRSSSTPEARQMYGSTSALNHAVLQNSIHNASAAQYGSPAPIQSASSAQYGSPAPIQSASSAQYGSPAPIHSVPSAQYGSPAPIRDQDESPPPSYDSYGSIPQSASKQRASSNPSSFGYGVPVLSTGSNAPRPAHGQYGSPVPVDQVGSEQNIGASKYSTPIPIGDTNSPSGHYGSPVPVGEKSPRSPYASVTPILDPIVASIGSGSQYGSPQSVDIPSATAQLRSSAPAAMAQGRSPPGTFTPSHSRSSSNSGSPTSTFSSPTHSRTPSTGTDVEWREVVTPEGTVYYYEKYSRVTTWTKPEGVPIKKMRPRQEAKSHSKQPSQSDPTINTEQLLTDESKINFFMKFLETEGDIHNAEILFIMELEVATKKFPPPGHLLTQGDIMRLEMIYNKFLAKDAVLRLDMVSRKTADKIKAQIKASKDPQEFNLLSRDVFQEARTEVIAFLEKEQLPRFMKSMFYISMYNAMTSRQPYELPDSLWREFITAADGGNEDGWEYVTETKGVLIYRKQFRDSPGVSVRGSGVVPVSPEEMRVFALSMELRKEWDPLYTNAKVVEKLDEKTAICYYEYRAPKWAVGFSGHDFVTIRTERRDADGSILVLSRSVVHRDCPEKKGTTRSDVDCAGFLIRPCGVDSSVVIYIAQANMKGVPQWAEKRYVNKRALTVRKIRKFVEKELKESKKKTPAWRRKDLDIYQSTW